MPRARGDKSVEAEKLYRSGEKLVDIARIMGVPDSTVRRWKSDQEWENRTDKSKKKITERSEIKNDTKPNARKRKRGAQPGHPPQGGAPLGNINAVTNGAYMQVYGDLLTDEENKLLKTLVEQDERERLRVLYAQHQITERRLMQFIKEILDGNEMITFRTVSQIGPTGKKKPGGKQPTKVINISQEQQTRKEQIRNFTDALTRVRAEMRRVADSIRQLDETETKRNVSVEIGGKIELNDPYKALSTEELRRLIELDNEAET